MQNVTFVLGKGLDAIPSETLRASDSTSIPCALLISVHGRLVVVSCHIFTRLKLALSASCSNNKDDQEFFTLLR